MYNKKIWGFILTMWYVKITGERTFHNGTDSFILTMWYVKNVDLMIFDEYIIVLY